MKAPANRLRTAVIRLILTGATVLMILDQYPDEKEGNHVVSFRKGKPTACLYTSGQDRQVVGISGSNSGYIRLSTARVAG